MLLWTFSPFSVFTSISSLDQRRFPNNLPKNQERNAALDSWQGLQSVICISWITFLIRIEQWVPFKKQYLISCSSTAGLCEQGPLTLFVPLKLPLWILFSYCILCPIFCNFISTPRSVSWQFLVTVGNAFYCIQPWYKTATHEPDRVNELSSHQALQHTSSFT